MFERIKTLLGLNEDTPAYKGGAIDEDQLAAAALMVHAVAIDGVVDKDEKEALNRILKRDLDLDEGQVTHLIELARAKEREAVDLFQFTRRLKAHLPEEKRRDLVAAIWELVYADGVIHEFEDNVVWRIADLLGLSNDERIAMKMRAKARLQDETHGD